MAVEIPDHLDLVGNILKVGDAVATPVWGGDRFILGMGVVMKINPKTVAVNILANGAESARGRKLIKPSSTIVVDGDNVSLFMFRHMK